MKYDDRREVGQVQLMDVSVEVLGAGRADWKLKMGGQRVDPVHKLLSVLVWRRDSSGRDGRARQGLGNLADDDTQADPVYEDLALSLVVRVAREVGQGRLLDIAVIRVNDCWFALAQSRQPFSCLQHSALLIDA